MILFVFALLLLGARANNVSYSFSYTNEIIQLVVPPYSAAYQILTEQMLAKLISIKANASAKQTGKLLDQLICSSRKLHKNLLSASSASDRILNSMDEKILEISAQLSVEERKLHAAQESVNEATIAIDQAKKQISETQAMLKDQQSSYERAQQELEEAQKSVEKIRICREDRRKKRSFSSWFKEHVQQPFKENVKEWYKEIVNEPVRENTKEWFQDKLRTSLTTTGCEIVNSLSTESAKDRRLISWNRLRDIQQRLYHHEQILTNQQLLLDSAKHRLIDVETRRDQLQAQQKQLKTKQKQLAFIIKKLRLVDIHLGEVLASSEILEDFMLNLFDFQTIVGPLIEIYEQMIENNEMIFLLALLPLVLGKPSIAAQLRLISSPIDQLTEQPLIDRVWQDCLITAPATINLLGHVMIAASSTDVSFLHYSPNRTFRYIKYPDSLRTTLLQISNEGYDAFRGAHNSMNRIHLSLTHLPRYIQQMMQLLNSSDAMNPMAKMILVELGKRVEKIGSVCVKLSRNAENSFVSVMHLLSEVLEAIEHSRNLHDKEVFEKATQLNTTQQIYAALKQEQIVRQQRYDEVRKAVYLANEEYSEALKEIPTGYRAVGIDLGRAVLSMFKLFSNT